MANMPDLIEVRVTDYLARGVTPPALTGPMNVVLLSALGAGDAAGTPVAGTVKAYGPTAAGTNPASNGALLRWEGLANPTTVAGFRIQDSAATPTATQDNIPLTGGSKSVTDGIFEVPAGGLTVTSA
ncbi:MAG: hypothetical protein M3P83_09320 [Actinomycetota bacterium]|nr:hypothetical protein [Actinomycetota bacterium]